MTRIGSQRHSKKKNPSYKGDCLFVIDLAKFNVHGSVNRNNILICIQQDATLHSLFYLKPALRVSGGTATYHQERKLLYLQHLVFVTQLLLSAAIVEELELVLGMLFHDSGR